MGKARKIAAIVVLSLLMACSKDEAHTLRVVASPTPHAEMLEYLVPILKKQGIDLEIVTLTDYLLPNKLIDEKEVDANFFQHLPFLQNQKREERLDLEVMGKIHLEPMGIYSKNLKKGDDFSGKKVALPLDPTNEARSLKLLEEAGLITLNPEGYQTILDITSNPMNLQFIEIDAALLPRIFDDVDLACIPTNFALQAGLNPSSDALYLESKDSPYANILVINPHSEKKEALKKLLDAMKSKPMQEFIKTTYQGAIIPAD